MAPSRSSRHPRAQASLYADGSSSESDSEQTPRQRGKSQAARKRISETQDGSLTEDANPGRVPLKAVNINDDSAEKRRRRKSAKNPTTDNAEAGPSTRQDGTEDAGAHAHSRHKQALKSTIVETPIIDVPLDIRNSNYEEWMKMAMDNKINQANSWNFALIDYFHDMSLLRNNVDNSINFQRASSTLDGCVKIWTSRVDSVGTETGKLLSNLASDGREAEDEEPTSDNPDAQEPSQKRRKANRSESTLAKNAIQLKSKKLDLEFSVDPLFRKTCEDFDEGGAHGLLMNHLSLGVGSEGALRVIFDASDSMGKVGEDEDLLEPQDDVDLTALRSDFLPDLEVLERKAISHSLEGFSFSKDTWALDEAALFLEDTPPVHDDGGSEVDGFEPGPTGDFVDADHSALPEEDFFMGDNAVGDDLGGDDLGPGYAGEDGENGFDDAQTGHHPAGTEGGRHIAFDPRRAPNERALIMAMTDADAGDGMLDYFDQSLLKNWAGPEHWKLRKTVRRPDITEAAIASSKPKREKKEAFKIDFSSPVKDLKETAKELFAPVTRGAGITLPKHSSGKGGPRGKKGKVKGKQHDHTLPDDMHFSSRQLITLFLKPKFSLRMRGQRASLNENGDGEVDENFWARAAADQAAGRATSDGEEETSLMLAGDGSSIPFNTQFFHDDYDDGPGFDDGFDGDLPGTADPGEQDLLADTQGRTRRVRPEFIKYTKRAKRVDVRKLKENIWKGLKIPTPDEQQPADTEAMDVDPDALGVTNSEDARTFDEVIVGLQRSYPGDKLAEISTSFCFICLLHLANERGLKLETGDDAPSAVPEVKENERVGNIWSLKVYRDVNATPAA
ncbi:condensin complex subunit 2/barren [Russula ochroleuca]|uniref:Condensin complex subunit 2 n=1 Tax=Russula ochroleuca TaxID=152965 RepID=A0A9P5MVN3_9AGAM|nr:condensin complex subunit 2/barren [Russula ochroleuca]